MKANPKAFDDVDIRHSIVRSQSKAPTGLDVAGRECCPVPVDWTLREVIEAMVHEVQNFQEDVLEASRHQPVIVDFWAPWCGPCRVLGPVLEQLAVENADKWKLAKVNTDENPQLSMQYGIRGIPAVKMFIDGKVVDEFTGALPRHAVEQWLERALPSEDALLLAEVRQHLAGGDLEQARSLLSKVLEENPSDGDVALLLAQIELFDDPGHAAALVAAAEIVDPVSQQVAEGIATIARLISEVEPDELPEGPGRKDYIDAIHALRNRDFDAALDSLIEVIAKDRYYDDDGARKACLALFSVLGEEDDTTRSHRRQFNMALY